MKRLVFLIIFILLFSIGFPSVFAQNNESELLEIIDELKNEIKELRSEIRNQKKEYDRKIEELKSQLSSLKEKSGLKAEEKEHEEETLDDIKKAAENELQHESESIEESTEFKAGSLSLQSLNPELSLVGDFMGVYTADDSADDNFDFNFRTLGLHFQSYLDPYSRLKGALEFNEEGAEFGEAYFTRYGVLLDGLNVTMGKFRQQFGVVNRWHKHGLDWVDFPLPLRKVFGEGGLNQTGISFDYNFDLGEVSNSLTFQITNGSNGAVFGENGKNKPSILLHYKNYRDLDVNSYFEFGFTGLWGWNNEWNYGNVNLDERKNVSVYGADFCYLWEPVDRMRYRNFEVRGELYYIDKDIVSPVDLRGDDIKAWGAYVSLKSKFWRTLEGGIRVDYFKPDEKNLLIAENFSSIAEENDSERWLYALYFTWYQSPFVKYRFEYDYECGDGNLNNDIQRIYLQAIFAAVPHKHEKY